MHKTATGEARPAGRGCVNKAARSGERRSAARGGTSLGLLGASAQEGRLLSDVCDNDGWNCPFSYGSLLPVSGVLFSLFQEHVWVQFPVADRIFALIVQIAQLASASTSNHESTRTASLSSARLSSTAACLHSSPARCARKSPPPIHRYPSAPPPPPAPLPPAVSLNRIQLGRLFLVGFPE